MLRTNLWSESMRGGTMLPKSSGIWGPSVLEALGQGPSRKGVALPVGFVSVAVR